ncbi:GNAT family N-acetyltransferase [Streptomyces kanamyceticus]|uniref:GNAT family N-acetyltransferase n=1 Tax=Streptomyces kanamyceticus TaxID=1967 RepID=A0A5J6GU21_STRKN|nr:GNAT family N-acetyltransferase [Streptomyces kanamyceticus]QEU97912.1 GNAT family N-acetyltransferase [Streptomyces kanamyceticus]
MGDSVIRLTQYTMAERDEITGGGADPFGVASAGLTWRDKDVHFGLRRQDRLVAHAGWVRVPLSVGSDRWHAAGLGGVAVASDLRGQGLARQVVTAAMEHARDAGGLAHGLLFCVPRLTALYGRMGWHVLDDDIGVEQPDVEGPVRMPLRAMWTPLTDDAKWPTGEARLHSLPM